MAELRDVCSSCSIVPTYHCNIDPGMLWQVDEQEIGSRLTSCLEDSGAVEGAVSQVAISNRSYRSIKISI